MTTDTANIRRPLNLAWQSNQRDGKEHEEWCAPCGCAYHPEPQPHVHPCDRHKELTKMEHLFGTLLDRIEIEEDHTLARQRFDIARECGYEVVFGEKISGETH